MEPDFDETEQVMSAHVSNLKTPALTEAEKNAMRQFCLKSIELKKSQSDIKRQKLEYTSTIKENRTFLQEWIRSQGKKCFIMPKHIYHESVKELEPLGVAADLPCYLRLQKNTSDSSITPSVAEASIMQFNDQLFQEKIQNNMNPVKALIESILDNARNSIRSTKETVSLSKNAEKGLKPMEVEEVPEDIAEIMVEMYKAQQVGNIKVAEKKEKTSDVAKTIKALEPTVASILEKTGESKQDVTLDGIPGRHRLKRKIESKGSSKINLTKFEEILTNVLESVPLETENPKNIVQSFKLYRKDIVKRVQLRLTSIPKKEVVNIKLISKYDKEESEEEN